VAWFKQLNAAGLNSSKQTMLTISVTEDEVLGIGGENLAGFYSAMKYFQSQTNPENVKFVEAFKKALG
jgi:urea transport system substrate-binding protein